MLLFFVRHGDPTYAPDALTPLGRRQAEAVARRIALYGVDKIYSSTSTRAYQTAKPTAEILRKPIERMEFCHENLAWKDLSMVMDNGIRTWAFMVPEVARLFNSEEIRALGDKWYTHPAFDGHNYGDGIERIRRDTHAFLEQLGYEFDPEKHCYRVTRANNDRIALFAHQGFGLAFLSCLLDIPYPMFSTHFDMGHTGMTVIEFREVDGYAIPRTLTLANDSHIYRDGLPTFYQNEIRF